MRARETTLRTLIAKKVLTDEEAASLAGRLLTPRAFDVLIDEDADVTTDTGEPLLYYRKQALPLADCLAAYRNLRKAATPTDARGIAAGEEKLNNDETGNARPKVREGRLGFRNITQDGRLSRQWRTSIVNSGIIGFFDRSPRFPYCRQTAFTMNEKEQFWAALPLLQRASEVFREVCPDKWAVQQAITRASSQDFVIPGTVFTTVTVNKNWQTAVHQDAGDLKEGFGVMAALRSGLFDGGYLVFPQYRVAVNMRTQGLLLADVHQWHGNTPMKGKSDGWERVSLVMYYRNGIRYCGTAQDELERVKSRKQGTKLNG